LPGRIGSTPLALTVAGAEAFKAVPRSGWGHFVGADWRAERRGKSNQTRCGDRCHCAMGRLLKASRLPHGHPPYAGLSPAPDGELPRCGGPATEPFAPSSPRLDPPAAGRPPRRPAAAALDSAAGAEPQGDRAPTNCAPTRRLATE
jgi:hypothetical protein